MGAQPVNRLVIEPLADRLILEAARELERQYLADAVIAFDLAEIACRHEQDEIHQQRPKTLDQLPDTDRAAFIANAKASLRMNRPEWRVFQHARMQAAALEAIRDLASHFVPAHERETLALLIASRVSTAGRFALDELTLPPSPREFATALQIVQRRGER